MITAGPAERTGAASGMNAVARFMSMSLSSAIVALSFGLGRPAAAISCLEVDAAFAVVGAVANSARRLRRSAKLS